MTTGPSASPAGPQGEALQVAPRPTMVALVPQYFVAFIALLYASGFLVLMAFLDRYGIRESGTELWRARYIHIGFLALAIPVLVNAVVFAVWYIIKHPRDDLNEHQMRKRMWPVMFLLVSLELVCMFMIMFTRGGQPGTPAVGLAALEWILGVTLLGFPLVLVVNRLIERVARRLLNAVRITQAEVTIADNINAGLRWAAVVAVLALDSWFFADFVPHLGTNTLWLGGLYLALSIVVGILIGTIALYSRRPHGPGNAIAYRVIMLCVLVPVYYLMLLAFAYGVFPLIPAPRGGGDYTDSPRVVVYFAGHDAGLTRVAALGDPANTGRSKPLILLEESRDGIYVADPNEGGGPAGWRSVSREKPRVFFLRRDECAAIAFESRSTTQRP